MTPPTQTGAAPSKGGKRGITSPSRRGGSGRVLADVLVDLGFVERAVMDEAIEKAHSAGSASERVLLTQGALTEDELGRAVAERFGLDHVDLRKYKVDPDAAKLVTPAAVKRYQAVPVSFVSDRTLLVAMADPANVLAVDDIAVMTGYEVRPAVASGKDIEWLLERLEDPEYAAVLLDLDEEEELEVPSTAPSTAQSTGPMYDVRDDKPIDFTSAGEDASVIQLVHRIITEAVDRGVSDIHFEPQDGDMRVRYRIDGGLRDAAIIPEASVPAGASRVKILSDLDIAERRIPQDCRSSLELDE